MNRNPHTSHRNGLSPLCCALTCAFKLSFRRNVAEHFLHANGFDGAGDGGSAKRCRLEFNVTLALEVCKEFGGSVLVDRGVKGDIGTMDTGAFNEKLDSCCGCACTCAMFTLVVVSWRTEMGGDNVDECGC